MNPTPDHRLEADRELSDAVRRLRGQWRRRVIAEGVAKIAAAALFAWLAGAALTALFGAGSATVVTMRVLGYLLIATATLRYLLVPVVGQPDDSRLALYVEERAPELQQALVSAVHELKVPVEDRPSPALSTRVVRQALAEVRRIEAGPGLERSRLARAAGVLAGVGAVAAFLLVVGPQVLRDAARVLFIPWSEAVAAPAFTVQVTPGNASVPRGGAIQLRATLQGFASEAADLVLRSDTATEWVRIPMLRDSAASVFTARLFDLTQPTEYYIESDGVRSKAFKLAITNLPAVQKLALELRFPAYTGLPVERMEEGGDVAAVRGTTVTVRATLTMPVRGGSIRLDGGTVVPMRADSTGRLIGSYRVARDGFYRVDLVAPDGTPVPGTIQYAIEALEDRGPSVHITEPGRDTKATSVEEVTVGIRASDEYGVTGLALQYSVNGGPEKRVTLTDSTGRRASPELRAAHTFFLEELGLKPGDLVSYFATATDGAGNAASSDIYFLEIRPFGRDYKQAEQGGGGGGGQSPEGLSARQRDIVAGTFNWLRDSAKTAERERRENVTTLTIGQGRIKEDVEGLARRLVERNVVGADTAFRVIHTALDSAGREMQSAEEHLGRGFPREALPFEQRALQLLQRAEAAYREVQVQMGQQGGGGGGGGKQSRAEDLADLFELETDKLQNQYEAVQQEQQRTAQQEIDETAERLKRLASRQQQENERMQRMADALRERLGQQNGASGGGGGQQRQLAQEAEEEARRLERLARERNSPELAEAARQMQQAADAMRRAASGSSSQSQQGNAALDRLRNATKGLENARSTQLTQEVRDLQKRAEEMGARQKEISEGVGQLPQSGTERAEQLRRLTERKDGLAGDVDRLQADAERLSRAARRDQPGAAGKLGKAAEDIQETRLKDKINFSKNVIRSGSPEYARSFEGQISQNIQDVTARLSEAAGTITESADGKRDAALERARELVRGLESMRERIGASDSAGVAGSQPGQPGRAGGNNTRQFSREFGLRREAAEGLRRDLAGQTTDVADLDGIIRDLRRLESGRPFTDPKNLEALQQAVIEGLKRWEFKLWRQLGQGNDNRPAMGAPAEAPAEYRALVEEYYRSLARKKPPR